MDINTNPDIGSNSNFGWFFATVLAIVAVYMYWKATISLAMAAATVSLLLVVITHFAAQVLTPFNLLWFKLGTLLGKLVSPIVLGVIFFGLITPLSILMKIFGRDELLLKKRSISSFWIDRDPVGQPPDSFKNQF